MQPPRCYLLIRKSPTCWWLEAGRVYQRRHHFIHGTAALSEVGCWVRLTGTGVHTVQVCTREVIWATLHNATRQWTLFIRAKFSGEPAGLNIALSWPEVSVTIKLNSEAQVMFFQVSRNNSNLIQSTEEWFIGYLFSLPGSFFPLGVQNKY